LKRKTSRAVWNDDAQVGRYTFVVGDPGYGRKIEVMRAVQTQKLLARFAARPQYHEVPAAHDLTAPSSAAWPEVSHAVTAFAAELVTDVV
jgi:hypothetical protein